MNYQVNKDYLDYHHKATIELYLFCYSWSNEFISIINELKNSNDTDNIALALAMLENYENKSLKKEIIILKEVS
jgi:hypothetical protein